MARRTAVVVGGGIAGLAAAAGLHAGGWRVMVLERAREFSEVGAGLAVTPNGLAAAGVIGVRHQLIEAGQRTRLAGFRDYRGDWVFRLPYSPATVAVGIHRQRLHAILQDAARHTDLRTGAAVVDVEPGDPSSERARVRYTREGIDHRVEADLVVAADGIRSTVRERVLPAAQVRYSGRTCWRGIADLPGDDQQVVGWWGPSAEAGVVPIGSGRCYWYGYVGAPEGDREPDEKAAALRRFADWPADFRRCIEVSDSSAVLRHDVYRLRWPSSAHSHSVGRVVLIGDAAHAMLPTMGQGANSALEDAVSLAAVLSEDLTTGLRRYRRLRWRRTQRMMRQSEVMDRLGAGLKWQSARSVRDAALRLTPTPVLARGGDWLVRWTPPI